MSSLQAEKERLQASLAQERRELELALADLKSTVKTTAGRKLDPRERIADSPYRWLVVGFAIGVWLARPRR